MAAPIFHTCIFIILFSGCLGEEMDENQLETRLSRAETDIKELRAGLVLLQQQNRDLVEELTTRTQKRLLLPTTVQQEYVAFTAKLQRAYTSLNNPETIIFDTIVTNAGRGYDNKTGIFVCPVSGFYQFAATVVSESGTDKNLDAELMHNGHQIVRLHATLYGYDEGSQVVNIHCRQGERVWIRHMMGAGDSAKMPAGFSTFSGALLSVDN